MEQAVVDEVIEAFAREYPFPLDPFQREAIAHLAENRSVLVAAPTGTGKTVVAEAGIWLTRSQGKRVIYTAPLKALSNQKFRDLREMYGQQAVGLVTGDIVEYNQAPIVVMTTEIYRNMLLEAEVRGGSAELAEVGCVIFDELHYVSDPERGPVWEEAIIHSPKHILLVGLSATVSNAEELARWISHVHRPISLVYHTERAIPLEHYYYLDGQLYLVMDADRQRVARFPKIGGEAKRRRERGEARRFTFDGSANGQGKRAPGAQPASEPGGEHAAPAALEAGETPLGASAGAPAGEEAVQETNPIQRDSHIFVPRGEREPPEAGELLNALRRANLLPCIYFLPGRRIVEETALSVTGHLLTNPTERTRLEDEVAAWLLALSPEDRELEQVQRLTRLLPRGLAYHHAGLLPGLKVLVETLFQRGYLKAVFATDTLALGINMPARSVVVGSLSKFDGTQMRLLTPNEYQQLTGRAGRRGMDERGAAVLPYSPWEPFEASFAALTGELLPVNSAFVIRYNSVLNLWGNGNINRLRQAVAASFREFQRYSRHLQKQGQKEQKERKDWGDQQEAGQAMGTEAAVWQAPDGERAEAGPLVVGGEEDEVDEIALMAQMVERASSRGHARRKRKRSSDRPAIARALSRAGAAELYGTIQVLQSLDYLGMDDHLTLKGRLLRDIFHPAGILLAELIADTPLEDLHPAELAELASWFTFDDDRPVRNRNTLYTRLTDLRREVHRVIRRVQFLETELGLEVTAGISDAFHSVALLWWRGASLFGLQRHIDLAEGDLLVSLNQTIDLLQQVQAAIGKTLDDQSIWRTDETRSEERARDLQAARLRLERLRPLFGAAAKGLLRGIVLQSRSIPSMGAQVAGEQVPLDMEEDEDRRDLRLDLGGEYQGARSGTQPQNPETRQA